MIRVLIVDDEPLERVLIRKGFDWESHDFEVIGEAASASEAREYVERYKPEIVLTDINMPGEDGLELSAQIRAIAADTSIVIVTSYRDFDYARRALQLGVEDFLLKPVDVVEIGKVVTRIRDKRWAEEQQRQVIPLQQSLVTPDEDIVIDSFWHRLVEQQIDEPEAHRRLQLYGYLPILHGCVCLCLRVGGEGERREDNYNQSKAIYSYIQEHKQADTIAFIHFLNDVILYYCQSDYLQAKADALALWEKLCHEFPFGIAVGVSLWHQEFKGISLAYRQAKEALEAGSILGSGQFYTYEDYPYIEKLYVHQRQMDWPGFRFAVRNCLYDQANKMSDDYLNTIQKELDVDFGYLKLLAIDLLVQAGETLQPHRLSLKTVLGKSQIYSAINSLTSCQELNVYVQETLRSIMKTNDSFRCQKPNKLIEHSLQYVSEHLYQPELTLKTIAAQLFVNESYLSRVFKQQMGEPLISYITRKRIERSIELLNTTDLKVYEIAQMVGIRDPHYFSICFKKQMGITVNEYKKSGHQKLEE